MSAERIEQIYADKYNTTTTSRKDIGDIYVDGCPINIKSSNIHGDNYSPNLMSADKLFNHLSDSNNDLKFMFVEYEKNGDDIHIISETLVDAEHISWDCLSIQCQGKGVIQVSSTLSVDVTQTREEFLKGFSPAYKSYFGREREKLNMLEEKYANV